MKKEKENDSVADLEKKIRALELVIDDYKGKNFTLLGENRILKSENETLKERCSVLNERLKDVVSDRHAQVVVDQTRVLFVSVIAVAASLACLFMVIAH